MKKMQLIRQSALYLLLVGVFLGISSCNIQNDTSEDSSYTINNNGEALESRLTDQDSEIEIEIVPQSSVTGKVSTQQSFTLNLIADVDAPTVNGIQTQATMVHIFGNSARAAASYNVQGNDYTGAVDALQITSSGKNALRIRSGIEFSSAKANAVFIGNNNIWIAHSSEDPALTEDEGFSAVRMFGLSGFNINNNPTGAGLPGFAANSIHQADGRVYVTSGNNAGLTVLDENLSETLAFVDIPGARWVDSDEQRIVVLSGNPESGTGTITVLDIDDFSIVAEYSFDGADTPEAKSTVEIRGDLALVAAGQAGTLLIDLNNGTRVATIPVPDAESMGLNPDVVETNAASADDEFIFISNGEAGVYVAEANKNLEHYESGDEITIELIGSLKFENFESANHVAYRNKMLFVAAGLGGVKAVQLNRK